MSETLVAGRVPLDGPLPRPPAFSLISVATEVTEDIRAGAAIYPYPPDMPDANDPCADGTFRVKNTPSELVRPDGFPVFTAYLGEVCTAFGIGSWDEFKSRANIALAAREAWALERQLVGAQFLAAPSLNDANVTIVGGGAVAAAVAVSYLEDAIAATGQDGILHLTPSVVSYLGFNTFVNDRGVLRTAAGTRVVVGGGYVGAVGATGGGAAAAGQSWCYATGPILYWRSSTIFNHPDTLAEATDRDTNTVVYRAERDLWVGWDAQLQAAVLADWSP